MYCPIGDLKNPFCFSFHTSNHFVANCHLLGITVCFLVVQMSDMHPKCSYPNCLGIFPEGILEQCAIEGCTNRLHHACQTEYESSQNIDLGLHKYCFSCCDRKIKGVSQSKEYHNQIVERKNRRVMKVIMNHVELIFVVP